MTCKQRKTRSG